MNNKNFGAAVRFFSCYKCQAKFSDVQSFQNHQRQGLNSPCVNTTIHSQNSSYVDIKIKSEVVETMDEAPSEQDNTTPTSFSSIATRLVSNKSDDVGLTRNLSQNNSVNMINPTSSANHYNTSNVILLDSTLKTGSKTVVANVLSSINLSELRDFLRCYKCNSTFYKMMDLIPHFKQCNPQSKPILKNNSNYQNAANNTIKVNKSTPILSTPNTTTTTTTRTTSHTTEKEVNHEDMNISTDHFDDSSPPIEEEEMVEIEPNSSENKQSSSSSSVLLPEGSQAKNTNFRKRLYVKKGKHCIVDGYIMKWHPDGYVGFGCGKCDHPAFISADLFNQHDREAHPTPEYCPTCGIKCDPKDFDVHVVSHEEVRPILPVNVENPELSKLAFVTENGKAGTPEYLEAIKNDEKEQGNFKCLICDKVFTHRRKLYSHVLRKRQRGPYKKENCRSNASRLCTICGRELGSLTALKMHLRMHEGTASVKCTYPGCDKVLSSRCSFLIHELTHGEKKFKCTEEGCEQAFYVNRKLKHHINQAHLGLRPFKCDYPNCNKSFSSKANRSAHFKRAHSELKFPCPVEGCDRAFRQQNRLKEHELVRHGPGLTKKYTCTYPNCNRKGVSPHEIRVHIQRVHEKVKNYVCNECGFACFSAQSYNLHLATHSDYRPFQCESCGKSFKHQSVLATHKEIHNDQRPIKCQFCDKTFKQTSVLKRHELTHTKFKPYKCAFCEMAYPDNRSLKHHVAKEHEDQYDFNLNVPSTYRVFLRMSNQAQEAQEES